MHPTTIANIFFLCTVNAIFMIAGIFLNSVVIISLWRSSQLRKKLCYFTIFVLSCFDLSVVIINHPLIMASGIVTISHGVDQKLFVDVSEYIFGLIVKFAVFALETLTFERFLAITYPFFHERMVTKKRLIYFLALLQFLAIVMTTLTFGDHIISRHMLLTILIPFVSALLIYLNCKTLMIARSKRRYEKFAPASDREIMKRRRFNLKKMSTCSLAVVCCIVCFIPHLVSSVYFETSKTQLSRENDRTFVLWAMTASCINSTFNCLIFFWRNTVLRREGMKIIKNIQSRCCCLRMSRFRNA